MENNLANEKAFPLISPDGTGVNQGMTMREYFAAKAMQAMCHFDLGQKYGIAPEIAKRAVIMADALLNELSNPQNEKG